MTIKAWIIRNFTISKELQQGAKSAAGETLALVISACVAGFMYLATLFIPIWLGFISYMIAVVLLLLALFVIKRRSSKAITFFVTNLISSLLCIVISLEFLKLFSTLLLNIFYPDTALAEVPKGIADSASLHPDPKMVLILIAVTFAILLAYRWGQATATTRLKAAEPDKAGK
ncbi:hypothetical protein G7009_08930 [Pseudomonas capeferrum]|uniref:hypothetical protein n=1 Tax=Pseudomonas capeferrum TaxID=1495066 RepID=UPI0015E2AB7C|nr:hypothetical protein [Pseudomonas capeferrum]MBA1201882.1 hypothetical protein [Pseudomonas capeferrum]